MASRDRERMLARAKLERQQARRAAKLRKRRQREAQTAAGIAVLAVAVGIFFVTGGWNALFGAKKKPTKTASDTTTTCFWAPATTASGTASPSAGTPPTSGVSTTGTEKMTVSTSAGVITASLDREAAPCTVANFDYLASQNFFANTTCNRLTNGNSQFYLLCGDPSPTDPNGGPGYTYDDENPPLGFSTPPGASPRPSASAGQPPSEVVYPAGTVAVWNQASNSNGSQFIVVYKDTTLPPQYSVFGQITGGLDVLAKIGATGVAGGGHDGKPKTTVTVSALTVDPVASTPSAAPTTGGSPTAPAPSSSQ